MAGLDLWRSNKQRRGPLALWEDYSRDFERMFEDMESMFSPVARGREASTWLTPACDIEEVDNKYLMSFDMPGVDKKDVNVEVEGNRLMVSAQRKKEHREDRGTLHQYERYEGEYRRIFTLPETVDPNSVEADYDNGVLRIVVPKTEASKATKIKIGEEKSGFFKKLLHHGDEKEGTKVEAKTKGNNQASQAS
ncbi:MAG: Hsp20/alpha crystallin family protein [Oligoflexus sp.]